MATSGTPLNFPEEFEPQSYRRLNVDLAALTDSQLRDHYKTFGRSEGRTSNDLLDRWAFSRLIQPWMSSLEIGPFVNPMIHGGNVRYCDIFSQAELQRRAVSAGLDPNKVPKISFILEGNGLADVQGDFDALISSHCIEHTPDLIRHLRDAHRLLNKKRGRYFVLVPDKRYCFDRLLAESTVSDVVDAYETKRNVHSLRSLINYRTFSTHNDCLLHWQSEKRAQFQGRVNSQSVAAAVQEWLAAGDQYVDVHAWYFTPDSFRNIFEALGALNYTNLEIERLDPTRYGSNEFWVILKVRS